MNCDPDALSEAAKCFDCLTPAALLEITTFLLCVWTDALGPPVTDSLLLTDDGDFITTDAGEFLLIHS